jgi:hypothetical protein
MFIRTTCAVLIGLLLLCARTAHAKGTEGLVILKGVVHHAVDAGDSVSFEFSGGLSFSFFTADQGNSSRKKMDLKFDVENLRVVVPSFGESRGPSDDPYIVNFANAVKHSTAASKSGEMVTIVLFNPTLSFNINGVVEKAACTHAQVMPERVERRLRQ